MAITIESIEAILDKKFKEFDVDVLKPMKVSIEDLKVSLNFMSQQYDDLMKSVKKLQDDNKTLQVENSSLRKQLLAATNDLNLQKDALNEYEQYSRRDCLEFSGIPKRATENTNQIVIDIAEAAGVDIEEDDISVSHRLPPNKRNNDRPPVIIAKFVRRDTREQLYRARKELRNKTTQDIGFSIHNKIFIPENLTLKNRELFKKCLQFKKAANYKFIWTSSGKIYLRKDGRPESRATQVTSSKDLDRLSQAMQQYG